MESPASLREALAVRGLSVRAAARMLNYDHAYLSRVLTGKQVPSPQFIAALEELCGVPVTEPTPESLAGSLAGLRREEDAEGPGKVRAAALSQGGIVIKLADDASGQGRPHLVHLASEWASFAGWIDLATGHPRPARKWFDRAMEYAAESDDPTMSAHVLSFKGYLAGYLGNSGAMEGLTAAARRVRKVHPAQVTYNAFQHARSLVMTDNRPEAARVLDVAASSIDEAVNEEPLAFAYWYTRPFFMLNVGYTQLELGNRHQAADLLTDGLAELPAEQRGAEWVSEFRSALQRAS